MELKRRQELDLITKILYTKSRVYSFLKQVEGYLSFSGGRDSTILSHIIRTDFIKEYPEVLQGLGETFEEGSFLSETFNVPHVFINTGVEWASIVKFVRDLEGIELIEIKPKLSFFEVVKQYGYPVISKEVASYINDVKKTNSNKLLQKWLDGEKRGAYVSGKVPDVYSGFLKESAPIIGSKCCQKLKKDPAHAYEKASGRRPILAIMADESRLRAQTAKNGCIFEKTSGLVCNPMIFWTHEDIELYMELFKPAVCELYTKYGFERTGCIGCLFGCQTKEKADEKLEVFKRLRPNQYQWYLENGMQDVLNYLEVNDKMSKEEKLTVKRDIKESRGISGVYEENYK